MKKLLLVVIFLLVTILSTRQAWAGVCRYDPNCGIDECKALADECTKQINMLNSALKPNEDKMNALTADISALEANIKALSDQLDKKKIAIDLTEQKFSKQQGYLNSQVRDFYKINWTSPVEYFLVTVLNQSGVGDTLHDLAYHQSFINQQKKTITSLVLNISDLQKQKKDLEDNQNWLAAQQVSLATTLAPIKKLVADAKAYQSQLNQTVGALNARQQQLIAAKLGSLNLSRSANISMACSDDRKIDPGFSPAFAFYTFGIPHRVGMSQFGAYGRANAGQSYDQILRAYFNFDNYQDFDVTIKVDDNNANIHWSGSLEDYVKRIYEVPVSWPGESLKAQAIAARSYALAYTNNGSGSICATQDCQVFKTDPKGGAWDDAVNQTSKKAMVVGGKPIKAWFSSTDGGYTHTSSDVFGGSTGWTKNTRDTSGDINNISDLFSKAYDRDSPCFYNAQGWRTQYNKSAWLRSEEVADIVNVILLSAKTNDWDGWDAQRVKQELGSGAFSRIDSISMSFDLGYGKTTSVTLSGDAGSKTFDGKTFKDYFNARAPANIAIVGPLYNIEKR